ncbi:MAG: aldolase/citrate lyase family protein [Bryobacterales bacterium]
MHRRTALAALAGGAVLASSARAQTPAPKRINKAIDLLAANQPIYYFTEGRGGSQGGFEEGLRLAKTWADFIIYEMEFGPFDPRTLREFMGGLINGGPTASGHRTPAVQVVVPFSGLDAQTVRSNHWVVQQILAAGVHGVTLCHARDPKAVEEFVRCARFPHHREGVDGGPLQEGLRGNGGQGHASSVWGLSPKEYMRRADVWPLNPQGEVLIGLKLEDKYCLENAAACASVPGVGYAEWGPGDMGLSLGYPDIHDPPYPDEVEKARLKIMKACKDANIAFLDVMTKTNVEQRIREGVKIVATRYEESAAEGRRLTKRPQPW